MITRYKLLTQKRTIVKRTWLINLKRVRANNITIVVHRHSCTLNYTVRRNTSTRSRNVTPRVRYGYNKKQTAGEDKKPVSSLRSKRNGRAPNAEEEVSMTQFPKSVIMCDTLALIRNDKKRKSKFKSFIIWN